MSLLTDLAKKIPVIREDLQPSNAPVKPTEYQRIMDSLASRLNQNLPPTENSPPMKTGYGQLLTPDAASQPEGLINPDPNNPQGRVNSNLPVLRPVDNEPAPIPSEYEKAGWNVQGAMNAPVVNKDHGFKGAMKELTQNFLAGIAQQSQNPNATLGSLLGGGLGGAGGGAINRTWNEQRAKDANVQRRMGEYGVQKQLANDQLDQRTKTANAVFAEQRPDFEQAKIDQKNKELDGRAKSNTMRVVASVYNKLPVFDSKDPANADVVAQMQEAGLPVIDKNPNKDIKYVQDEDSGEMFIVSTDKQTGETSAEQVMQNGSPLKLATKSQIGMRVKDLDRTSREKIAEARNNTLLKVTGINAGSREKVAGMNIQGASDRVDKQIKGADDRQKQELFNSALQKWQQQFQKTSFRAPKQEEIDAAKQSIQKTIYGQ